MEVILLILLGLSVGLSSALLGLGGNIIIVPILPLISKLSLQSVVATGIFTVFIVTFVNVINFYRQNLLDKRLILLLFFPTAIGSFLSSSFAINVDESIIKWLFIFVMSAMIVRLFLNIKESYGIKTTTQNIILICAGLFSGALAGLTGVGTGVILGPLLLSLNITDHKKISPTINFLIMCACFSSSLNYLSWNNLSFPASGLVRLDYALYISLPALISAIMGRKMNAEISPVMRRYVVGGTLIILLGKTLYF